VEVENASVTTDQNEIILLDLSFTTLPTRLNDRF
jgi:hypothetical protein